MFEQYWRNKATVPGALLFYRMGDFFELFGEDAVLAAPILEIQLTARDRDSINPVPMCGVPAHSWEGYAEKLLAAGHKIALCEQLSDPALKQKLVERGVVRILTPGLPIHFSRLDGKAPHWFLSVGVESKKIQILAYDFLGAQLFSGEFERISDAEDLFRRLAPKEILIPAILESALLDGPWAKILTVWSGKSATENLRAYLMHTQRVSADALGKFLPDAQNLALISGAKISQHAGVSANVLEQWGVFPQLFDLLDGSGSAVGSRRLRTVLATPLRDVERIVRRQKLFEKFAEMEGLSELTREVYDFERILGRFRVGAAAPKELIQFLLSLVAIEKTLALIPDPETEWQEFSKREGLADLERLRRHLMPLKDRLVSSIDSTIDAARTSQLSLLLKVGFDAELDRLKALNENSELWLQNFETRLRDETGISSLKLRNNRVFGHYIEVTKTHLAKVPPSFERKQTTVNGERFTTAELRTKETEILSAAVNSENRAREILEDLQREVLTLDSELRQYVAHFSWVDAMHGVGAALKKLRRFGAWNVPQISEGAYHLSIHEGRHPVIETLSKSFVANSLSLGGTHAQLLLLTGPNMAGKSTLMRQAGLCQMLAQCGLKVPAEKMECTPSSGFFSRMGASDRIFDGESTFMVEMKETAQILREADENSLVLIDEIGRGTSTEDGLAIAHAVLEYLHDSTKSVTIFATHYHELSEVVPLLSRAVNGSMAIQEWKGDLIFLRALEMKAAESSYGIYVAKMAGLPKGVLKQAQNYFDASAGVQKNQLTLFSRMPAVEKDIPTFHPLESELKKLPLDEMSPKDAWLTLERMISEL